MNRFYTHLISAAFLTAIGFLVATIPTGDGESPPSGFDPYGESMGGEIPAIEMVPLQGGAFLMGRDPGEPGYRPDEGPPRTVEVSDFWIGRHEITWEHYEAFMYSETFAEFSEAFADTEVDAVTRPSRTYIDPSFGMGRGDHPAVSMTQHAALAFTRWLSLKTGKFYRLPTEAEWEYACRAGTSGVYHFGDDPDRLDWYAWYYGNSDRQYQPVGSREPNPWGLYDMHGNVAEWVLDQYVDDYFSRLQGDPAVNPWVEPTDLEPNTVRGGSWYHDPEQLACGSRLASDPERWKRGDPQFPKSLWWNTNAPFTGFRIVRPVSEPTREEMEAFWEKTLDRFHYD